MQVKIPEVIFDKIQISKSVQLKKYNLFKKQPSYPKREKRTKFKRKLITLNLQAKSKIKKRNNH